MLSKEQAALAMGMKIREIVDVAKHPEGWVVTTHDGQRTLLEPVAEPPAGAAPVTPPPRMAARPAPAADVEAPPVRVSDKEAPPAEKPVKRTRGGGRDRKPAEPTAEELAAAEKAAADAAELAALLDDAAGGEAAILAWVGQDKQRAHLAHTAESDRQHPRVDLLVQLEQLADAS